MASRTFLIVASIAFAIFSPSHQIEQTTIFAGTAKGLSISNNDGITWPHLALSSSSINVLVGNVSGYTYAGASNGLYRSNGDDNTWEVVTDSVGFQNVRSVYGTQDGKEIYVGSEYYNGNFHYAHDGGQIWGSKTIGKKTSNIIGLGAIGDNLFALAHDAGLYSSSNKGDSWKLVKTSPQASFGSAFFVSGSRIYIGTYDGLFISTDQGQTFTKYTESQGLADSYIFAIFVRQLEGQQNETIYVATQEGISYSNNYGSSWKTYDNVYYVQSIFVDSNGFIYAGTTSYGLSISSDGIVWLTLGTGDGLADNGIKAVYAENRKISD